MTPEELTGRALSHVVDVPGVGVWMHRDVVAPFLHLREAAATAGFALQPVSAFRGFERQLAIWNAKFSGEKPLHDANGGVLDTRTLTSESRITAILLWSALPGASRHHWGTDMDLIDAGALVPGYQVRLEPAEFDAGGPFAALSEWLACHAARFGFFRPFRGILSGVRPEPWHLSFAPLAEPARLALTPEVLRAALTEAPLLGKQAVLAQIDELHARYVAAIDWP